MNSLDLIVLLFATGCVVGLGGALIEAGFAMAAQRRERDACARLARQPKLGLRERLGGDEIARRRGERRR